MTLSKRLDDLEDHHLSPRAAVVSWMKEAHQFHSVLAYGRWLLNQPGDAYPLIKMPAQVVAAVRAREKGTPDRLLRDEFYQVQRDMLFLYFLQEQANSRVACDQEAIHLRVVLLIQGIRTLIHEKWARDQRRLDRLGSEDEPPKRPGETEGKMAQAYCAHAEAWPVEAQEVLVRVLELSEAARLLSSRYFAGQEVLFPEARETLDLTMQALANLRDIYAESILHGAPESDEDLQEYLLALVSEGAETEEEDGTVLPEDDLPDVSHGAKRLAEQFILMAKSEALDQLGEKDAAERLCERLVRTL